MAKYSMKIAENKIAYLDYRLFDISFESSFLSVSSDTFNLRLFHRKAYLSQLIRNFKSSDNTCYLVFSAVIADREGVSEEKIQRALSLSEQHTIIRQTAPYKKWFVVHKGVAVCFLTLDDNRIRNVSEILDCIDTPDTHCYFVFDRPSERSALCGRIEDIYKSRGLDQNSLISLSLEFIRVSFQTQELGDKFSILTCRFDKEGIKNILLDSTFADSDKFEVTLR